MTDKRRHITLGEKLLLNGRQDGICDYCGSALVRPKANDDGIDDIELDHRKPLFLGGSDDLTNMRLLHRQCHRKKSAMEKGD